MLDRSDLIITSFSLGHPPLRARLESLPANHTPQGMLAHAPDIGRWRGRIRPEEKGLLVLGHYVVFGREAASKQVGIGGISGRTHVL